MRILLCHFVGVSLTSCCTEVATRGVLLKRCSYKFRKIHRKTPVPEPPFNKVAGLRRFPVNFAKCLKGRIHCEIFLSKDLMKY